MQLTCFLLGSVNGQAVLYLGEVSTVECLEQLPAAAPVTLIEFLASLPDGSWIAQLSISADAVLSELLRKLREDSQISIVDFAAKIGSIRISTHDDGEAELRFPSEEEALFFLRRALGPEVSAELIPRLTESRGRYVAKQDGSWKSFETFDAYVVSTLTRLNSG
jgi:hypothetical protein